MENMNKLSPNRTRALEVIAAFGLGFEALALGAAAVAYGTFAVLGDSQDVAFIAGIGAFCLVLAVGVVLASRGIWASRRWARSLALTWQTFQAGLGLAVLSTRPAIAVALMAVALVVAGCVLAVASQDDAAADDGAGSSDVLPEDD